MTEWQPIETAPKIPQDWQAGLPSFLVWDGKDIYCVEAGLYAKDNGCGCCSYKIEATHWMPLPAPPINTSAERVKKTGES
jgi:hypothetical protein